MDNQFKHSLTTGIREESIRLEFKALLEHYDSDEKLIEPTNFTRNYCFFKNREATCSGSKGGTTFVKCFVHSGVIDNKHQPANFVSKVENQ